MLQFELITAQLLSVPGGELGSTGGGGFRVLSSFPAMAVAIIRMSASRGSDGMVFITSSILSISLSQSEYATGTNIGVGTGIGMGKGCGTGVVYICIGTGTKIGTGTGTNTGSKSVTNKRNV